MALNEPPTDPVERIVALGLQQYGIEYVCNAPKIGTNRSLDFHLPTFGLYIECKRFHTDRLNEQISGLTNVIVIQGMEAATAFVRMLEQVHANGYNAG